MSYYEELVKLVKEHQDEERAHNDLLWKKAKNFFLEVAREKSSTEENSTEDQSECIERF